MGDFDGTRSCRCRRRPGSRAIDDAVAHFGRLDVLVNNAGVAPENVAENVIESDYDLTIAVNLKGTFFASQAAGRVMIRQNGGRIIDMSSQAGFAALPGESIYCMTKAGIAHLTRCLAVEWGRYNITVNAVAPTLQKLTPGLRESLFIFQASCSALGTSRNPRELA